MVITRRKTDINPFHELEMMHQQVHSLFTDPFDSISHSLWSPAIDITETDTELTILADIPGLTKKDITLAVQGTTLILRGERKNTHATKKEARHWQERSFGSFSRQVQLPRESDTKKIKAAFKNGVLEITVPKIKKETTQKIDIDIT